MPQAAGIFDVGSKNDEDAEEVLPMGHRVEDSGS